MQKEHDKLMYLLIMCAVWKIQLLIAQWKIFLSNIQEYNT